MANRVIHFEIHASDPERAIKFYQEIFPSWKIAKWGEQDYWMIDTGIEKTRDNSPIGGINGGLLLGRGTKVADGERMNGFVCTVTVDDFQISHDKILVSGGQVALEKMEMKGVGIIGYFIDTEGNVFGLLQPEGGNV